MHACMHAHMHTCTQEDFGSNFKLIQEYFVLFSIVLAAVFFFLSFFFFFLSFFFFFLFFFFFGGRDGFKNSFLL